jgi:hypothetical protein
MLILSEREIEQITGRRRRRAQARALAMMGISYRLRPDGFPIVARSHWEQVMGTEERKQQPEPDWSSM